MLKSALFASLLITFVSLYEQTGIAADEGNQSPVDKIKWQEGPSTSDLGKVAEVRVPAGAMFAGAADMKTIMEAGHNIPSGDEVGFIYEPSSSIEIYFEFVDAGYVKDDEKGALDADGMLKSLKAGNEKANEERRKRGWGELNIIGWEIPPRYNENTQNLEWATRLQGKEGEVINFNTRLLGRNGFLKVTLVTAPLAFQEALPKFRKITSDVSYKPGQRYAEYRQGDKVAKYGLTALVVGGAAAAAAKSGGFKGLWKLLVAAGAGVLALFKKLFGKKESA
jgi:uncharacterized membrane-anchored protein